MWCLVPLAGPDKGTRIELADGDSIGRSTDCNVRLAHASVSRVHAHVRLEGGTWSVIDAGSSNGVRHAGVHVEQVALTDGLRLRFGEVPARFEWAGEPLDAPAAATGVDDEEILDEDLDFDFDVPDDSGLELEEDPDLAVTAQRPQSQATPQPEVELAAPGPRAIPDRPMAEAPGAQATPQGAAQARQDMLRREAQSSAGLLRGDLSQQPGWVQGLVWLAVIAGMGGLAYLAFQLIQATKG
ncbi:MAG: FHA domain-containing protein [Planctomycetota bacterium]|jgi:hypothetical protein